MTRDGAVASVGPFVSTRFSVSDLPARKRYEVWRDSIACIFDVDAPREVAGGDNFHASIDMHRIGSLLVARTSTVGQHWRRSSLGIARDGMDHYMIQIYRRGTQRCHWRGGSADMPVNGLMVYDLSRRMRARSTALTNVSLILPRALLHDMLDAPDDQHMRALDERIPLVAALRDHMLALHRHAWRTELAQAATLAPLTAELVATCLNGAPAGHIGSARPVAAAVAAAVRQDIEQRLHDPLLGADDLCRRHQLSPTSLERLFADAGGVAGHIRERRLRAGLRSVLTGGPLTTVADVARLLCYQETGFRRAFRRRYGVDPDTARDEQQRQPINPHAIDTDRRYEYWLRSLAGEPLPRVGA